MTRRLTAGLLALALLAGPALAADAPRNTTPYPEEFKSAFVAGCTQSGMSKPACECFIRLLEPEWTADEVAAFGQKVSAEPDTPPPPLVTKIIGVCLTNPDAKTAD